MFDVGFSELVVIGIVALVVIGPERLPSVARTIGALLGRAQRYFNEVKSEVNRELQLDELKRMREQAETQMRSIGDKVSDEANTLENTIHAPPAEAVPASLVPADPVKATSLAGQHPDPEHNGR